MSNRHLARSIVMQSLFAWDFQGRPVDAVDALLDHAIEEFGAGIEETEFIRALTHDITEKQKILDDIIAKAAPDWPVDKISGVDRNALRIGIFELLFGNREQVPPKVAINEAIELGKNYGGENSGRFINGVLGAIYREIGEPGKNQTGKKKKSEEPVDLSKLPVEEKVSAVVYSVDDAGAIRFAMVHDVFGYWTLTKGSIKDGSTVEVGTVNKIKEEIGIDATVLELLGENEYVANHPENGKIRKHVSYFLAKAPFQELTLDPGTGGLVDAKWFDANDIADLRMYADVTEMLAKSVELITTKYAV